MLERLLRIKPFRLREGRWGWCPDCNGTGEDQRMAAAMYRAWCTACEGFGRRFVSNEERARGV